MGEALTVLGTLLVRFVGQMNDGAEAALKAVLAMFGA